MSRPPSLGLNAERRAIEASRPGGLDVRGPISRAIRDAGVTVPAAAPTPAASAPLSGLTADERRVHAILMDSLVMFQQQGQPGSGLSYVERKKLGDLDLAFIDAELAKMNRTGEFSGTLAKWTFLACVGVLAFLLLIPLLTGAATATLLLWAGGGLLAAGVFALVAGSTTLAPYASPQRKKIYHALRELALFAHPDDLPVSDALRQADLVIDKLAEADEPSLAPTRSRTRA